MNSTFSPIPVVRTLVPLKRDEQCGCAGCAPRWLQRFADPKAYLVIFCMLGIIQGAYFTYFIGVITTLEKRFAFESKVSGVIMIADNLSPIFTSLLIGYFGGKTHKPRLIAGGMMVVILSCFISALPYFIFGPGVHLLSRSVESLTKPKQEFCEIEPRDEHCGDKADLYTVPAVAILFFASFLNGFGYTAFYTIGTPYLDDNVKKKNSPMYFSAMAALRIFGPALGFLLSSFCLKFYEDPFYDPGIDAYNPRWVGAWWMGFLILGAALLVFTLLLALFPRELPERFRSEAKKKDEEAKEVQIPKLKDFPKALARLMKNPILVCHVISITFQINGFAGYFVFMPKFMESQYQQSASDASLFSGATGIIAMLLGILLGGFMIKKYKPAPRFLVGYMVVVEIFSVLGLMVSIFLGCPPLNFPGSNLKEDETLNLYNECNVDCSCTRRVFEPVCGSDGISTFFSPCFAGCPNTTGALFPVLTTTTVASSMASAFANTTAATSAFVNTTDVASAFTSTMAVESAFANTTDAASAFTSTMAVASAFANTTDAASAFTSASAVASAFTNSSKIFNDCKCLSGANSTFISSTVTSGFCATGCNMFLAYIIMLCISKFVSSTARVGNTLITFRCVEAKDKALALGAFGSVLAMFAFIPYPLIFGALTDSACLVWEENCSKTGNCWLYDSDKFRFYLHGMAMLLISIGICFDGAVFVLSDRLSNFYGEDDEDGEDKGQDRIARWLKEEGDEDVLFMKMNARREELQRMNAVD